MSQKSPAKRGSGSGKGKAAAAASPGGGGAHVTRSHTSSVTPKLTIIDLIKYEHDVVRYNAAMFRKTEDPELRQLLAYELIREISMHGAKEEMVLYPAVRAYHGAEYADKCLAEHKAVKELLVKLDGMSASDDGFEKAVEEAVELIEKHMKEEEETELPAFEKAVAAGGATGEAKDAKPVLEELGMQFHAAVKAVPTRPHPEATNMPPDNYKLYPKLAEEDMKMDLERFGGMLPPAATAMDTARLRNVPAAATAAEALQQEGAVAGAEEEKKEEKEEKAAGAAAEVEEEEGGIKRQKTEAGEPAKPPAAEAAAAAPEAAA